MGFALGAEMFEQYFLYMDKMTLGNTSLNMPAKMGLMLTGLLMVVFYSLLIPLRLSEYETGASRKSIWVFSTETLWPLTLENLRAFAKCLLLLVAGVVAAIVVALLLMTIGFFDRNEIAFSMDALQSTGAVDTNVLSVIALSLVMLAPSLFYYLRYSFVSYVVLVDPEYKAGRVDALKKSYRLAKGVTWILVVLFVAMAIFELWRSKLRDHFTFLSSPLVAIVVLLAFEALGLYFNILLFRIYELRHKSETRDQQDLQGSSHGTVI